MMNTGVRLLIYVGVAVLVLAIEALIARLGLPSPAAAIANAVAIIALLAGILIPSSRAK